MKNIGKINSFLQIEIIFLNQENELLKVQVAFARITNFLKLESHQFSA